MLSALWTWWPFGWTLTPTVGGSNGNEGLGDLAWRVCLFFGVVMLSEGVEAGLLVPAGYL
jgi:hypothetical protein